jgi:hypothetical protein
MSKISATALKKKYPHPQQVGRCDPGGYCVGGALCMELGRRERYPLWDQIIEAASRANPGIQWGRITEPQRTEIRAIASRVTTFNDRGQFNEAWKALGKLLRWPRP